MQTQEGTEIYVVKQPFLMHRNWQSLLPCWQGRGHIHRAVTTGIKALYDSSHHMIVNKASYH